MTIFNFPPLSPEEESALENAEHQSKVQNTIKPSGDDVPHHSEPDENRNCAQPLTGRSARDIPAQQSKVSFDFSKVDDDSAIPNGDSGPAFN